jgi:hypothetical protein
MLAKAQKDVFKAAVAVLSDLNLRAIRPPVRAQDQRWFDTPHFEAQRPTFMQARPLWPVMRQLAEVAQEKASCHRPAHLRTPCAAWRGR